MAPRPRSQNLKRALVAVSALTLAVCTAACGSGGAGTGGRDLTAPGTLLLQGQSALARASIVEIKGSIVQQGASGRDSLTVDATSAGKSGTSEGTLNLEGPGLGFTGSTRYVVIGSSTWVNGTTAFWKSYFGKQTTIVIRLEAKVFSQLVGHWVELLPESTDTMYKDTLGLSEPKVFVTSTLAGLKGTLTNSGIGTLDGASGVQVTSSTGGKIVIAGSGPPLPIELADHAITSGAFTLALAVSYPAGVTISVPSKFALLSAVLKASAGT